MKVSRVRKACVSGLERFGRVDCKKKKKNRCQCDIGYFGDPQMLFEKLIEPCVLVRQLQKAKQEMFLFQSLYVIIATELKT
jgi:hypothetical protein